MDLSTLGSQLRTVRKSQNLTLKDVASRSGVHWVTLSRLENGAADLGVRKLTRIAQALGLELTLHPVGQAYTLDDLAKGYWKENTTPNAAASAPVHLPRKVRVRR